MKHAPYLRRNLGLVLRKRNFASLRLCLAGNGFLGCIGSVAAVCEGLGNADHLILTAVLCPSSSLCFKAVDGFVSLGLSTPVELPARFRGVARDGFGGTFIYGISFHWLRRVLAHAVVVLFWGRLYSVLLSQAPAGSPQDQHVNFRSVIFTSLAGW